MVADFDFRGLGTGHSLVFLRLIVKPKVDAVMRMGMQSWRSTRKKTLPTMLMKEMPR